MKEWEDRFLHIVNQLVGWGLTVFATYSVGNQHGADLTSIFFLIAGFGLIIYDKIGHPNG